MTPEQRTRLAPLADRVIEAEGGYVDHPADLGGPTKYGITMRALAAARPHRIGAITESHMRGLTRDEARDIYLSDEWLGDPDLGLALIDDMEVAYAIFDTAVLFGDERGARDAPQMTQRAAGMPSTACDGRIGPRSAAAINAAGRARMLIGLSRERALIHAQRCKENPKQLAFLVGWLQRAYRLMAPLAGENPHAVKAGPKIEVKFDYGPSFPMGRGVVASPPVASPLA